MRILFPTPVTWDGNVTRYFQRDGGCLAQWVSENGHEGVKVIYSTDPSIPPPNTPLLAIGTPQQWLDFEFWKAFHADAALVYFGTSPKRAPIVHAMKKAGLRVILKMDSSWGFYPPFRDLITRARLDYFHHLDNPSGQETSALAHRLETSRYLLSPLRRSIRTFLKSFLRTIFRDIQSILFHPQQVAYFSLFDALSPELPFGKKNLRARLQSYPNIPPITALLHPCLNSFRFTKTDSKQKLLLAVACNWFFPRKGGKLLAQTLAIILPKHPEYCAVVIGLGSKDVKQRAEIDAGHPLPIETYPLLSRENLEEYYQKSQIYILTSGAESVSISTLEALASGDSFVYSQHLRQFGFALHPPTAATPAAHYTPTAFAAAIDTEINAWTSNRRSPIEISATYHKLAALSNVGQNLLDLISQL